MRITITKKAVLLLGAISLAVLLVAAACAKAAEPTATPKPVAGAAPTATPRPVAATATPAPAKVGLTEWVIGTSEDPTIKPTTLTVGGAVGPGRAHAEIYASMLRIEGKDNRPVPAAAESWDYSSDGKSLVFHLRKGIKSHKGTELTTADFKYSWDILKADPQLGGLATFRHISTIETPDPYTLKLTFSQPDVAFLGINASTQWAIPKERGAPGSPQATAFDKAPYGHGAYKVIRYERDKPIDLESFDGYFEGKAKPDKMKLIWMRDSSTRTAALLAGEAHVIEALSLSQAPALKSNPNLVVAPIKGSRGVYWQFNMKDEPFGNLKVRQALNYAMNKEVVVNDILGGYGVIMAAPLVRGWRGYEESKDLKPYAYDPVKAVSLLKEAGYERGFAFDFMASSGVFQKDQEIAEAYASMWEAIGLKPRLRITERGTIFDVFRESDKWDVSGTFQWGVSVEPDPYLGWLIGSYSKIIRTSPALKPLQDLKEKAVTILDPVERSKAYGQMNRLMFDLAILPYSHAQDELYGVNKATGWVPFPTRGSQAESIYHDHSSLMGYGPNYEKWGAGVAQRYWE